MTLNNTRRSVINHCTRLLHQISNTQLMSFELIDQLHELDGRNTDARTTTNTRDNVYILQTTYRHEMFSIFLGL